MIWHVMPKTYQPWFILDVWRRYRTWISRACAESSLGRPVSELVSCWAAQKKPSLCRNLPESTSPDMDDESIFALRYVATAMMVSTTAARAFPTPWVRLRPLSSLDSMVSSQDSVVFLWKMR